MFKNFYYYNYFLFFLGILICILVKIRDSFIVRVGYVVFCLFVESGTNSKEEIVVFGGGDNVGGYFNDFIIFLFSYDC